MNWMRKLMLGAVAVTVMACGDDSGPADLDRATFEGQLRGAVQASIAGAAAFGATVDQEEAPAFGIALASTDERYGLILFRAGTTRPSAGRFEVAALNDETNADAFRGIIAVSATAGDQIYEVRSGSMKVTSSSTTEFAGTVTLRARLAGSTNPNNDLFWDADFRAVPGTVEQLELTALRQR
jgi:hypothetical protein